MSALGVKHEWNDFLKYYGKQNADRETRIGMFDNGSEAVTDYWIEDGLPLKGIDIDFENGHPVIEIMLEGVTHVVRNVRDLRPIYTFDGNEEGMDINSIDGTTTILRFEN